MSVSILNDKTRNEYRVIGGSKISESEICEAAIRLRERLQFANQIRVFLDLSQTNCSLVSNGFCRNIALNYFESMQSIDIKIALLAHNSEVFGIGRMIYSWLDLPEKFCVFTSESEATTFLHGKPSTDINSKLTPEIAKHRPGECIFVH